MTGVTTPSEQGTSQQRLRWRLAFAFTLFVSIAGLVAAVQQFVLKFLWDEAAHTRTIGGVCYMSLGILGLFLPFLLVRKKPQFADLSPNRQWLVILGVPLAYVLAFVACVEASRRSTTLILPRPFAPSAVVQYNSANTRYHTYVEFCNVLRPHHPAQGFNHGSAKDGDVESFTAVFYQGFLRYPRQETTTLNGKSEILADGTVRITIDVDTKDRLQFAVRGLDNADIKRDGESISESSAKAGEYTIVVTGHPKEEMQQK